MTVTRAALYLIAAICAVATGLLVAGFIDSGMWQGIVVTLAVLGATGKVTIAFIAQRQGIKQAEAESARFDGLAASTQAAMAFSASNGILLNGQPLPAPVIHSQPPDIRTFVAEPGTPDFVPREATAPVVIMGPAATLTNPLEERRGTVRARDALCVRTIMEALSACKEVDGYQSIDVDLINFSSRVRVALAGPTKEGLPPTLYATAAVGSDSTNETLAVLLAERLAELLDFESRYCHCNSTNHVPTCPQHRAGAATNA